MKLSILIPVYNEIKTIEKIIQKVKEQEIRKIQIIVVDDGSTDGTREFLKKSLFKKVDKIINNKKNKGKGAAIRSAQKKVIGDIVIIQDADLEYDPKDYPALLKPFSETDADIVYGSRFFGGEYVRLHFFWHFLANKLLTFCSNIVTNLNMTDMETGYKVFKKTVIQSIDIKENSFGIEPEITVKLAKKKYIFYEVPISYKGRSYNEGKKITLKDAFVALYCIFKYRFFD